MEIGWNHPEDQADQWDGFNESGIYHFRSDPLQNLAREIIQNAIDALEGERLLIRFQLREIETSTIPHIDELRANMKHCLSSCEKEGEKSKLFFKNAATLLSKPTIKVLEASDYHTHGMRGPSENGTPFYAFMKAKGQSKKDGDTAAGSYGIGKFAPYAASDIRTVFVSTIYEDNDGKFKQLIQGKTILISHDVAESRRQGVGFWGIKNKCQPVDSPETLPDWITRCSDEREYPAHKGTKISILCFNDAEHWEEFLAASVAENFFGAIASNRLAVEFNGNIVLDNNTIEDFFTNPHLELLLKESDIKAEPERFQYSSSYYSTLTDSPEVIKEGKQDPIFGYCELKLIVSEGLPKKVCFIRNGMFISDNINRLKMFNEFKDFVAVLECHDPKGQKLLRQMEPPRHDDFEPNLLPTKAEQTKARKALAGVATWVRDILKKLARDPVSNVTPLDELKDIFGDEGGDGAGSGIEETNPLGEIKIRAKPIKHSPSLPKPIATKGDGETGEEEGGTGGGGAEGKGKGSGEGGKGASQGGSGRGDEVKKAIEVENVRALVTGPKTRRIIFTPRATAQTVISIQESGADSDYSVGITSTDTGSIQNGSVVYNCVSGQRLVLNVELSESFTGAIKVVANEI